VDENIYGGQHANWKSKDDRPQQQQQRIYKRADDLQDADETDNYKDGSDVGSVRQAASKWQKVSSDHKQEQPPSLQQQGLLRAASSEEFSAPGITRPGSDIESHRERGGEGNRHLLTAGESGLGSTYNVVDVRQYLRSYLNYVYPLCPLEICNDSVEDLIFITLRNTSSNAEQSQSTVLCVYGMLALGECLAPFCTQKLPLRCISCPPLFFFFFFLKTGARYAMHVERAREFFLSAKEQLEHMPEGEYIHICVDQDSLKIPPPTATKKKFNQSSPPPITPCVFVCRRKKRAPFGRRAELYGHVCDGRGE